jgi:hypothetical protein
MRKQKINSGTMCGESVQARCLYDLNQFGSIEAYLAIKRYDGKQM